MQPQTLPDVIPGGVATQLTSATTTAGIFVTVTAPASNAGGIRVGDKNVGPARGALIGPGGQFTFQRGSFAQGQFQLAQIYVYGTGGDAVTVTFA